ncbi:hypothetical protein RRG08_048160 [Elysia crispata]|uniref:Transposable element P transposase-like GTP-binding insertion domain-containing protein n=1 Tax=Elysia crispata TaxID=231223 RepID=A0AAE1DHF5_9GAST|nr:hypothetical protein RRG08_048160 [Elysia crispata]
MKVNIAAQTSSPSVATAIDHLRDDLKLPHFQGSEETCHVVRQGDKSFDTLNSTNPFAKDDSLELTLTPIYHEKPTASYVQCGSAPMSVRSIVDATVVNDTDWRQSCLFYTAGFVARRTMSSLL